MKINILKLEKTIEGKKILDIINIKIESGKLIAIIGDNGAGKTTLLKILAGLDKEYSGHIGYNGEKICDTKIREITMVFQKSLLLRKSVQYNIEFPLKIRKYDKNKIEKLTKEMLEKFELEELKNRKGSVLSGGEVQKTALARAMIFEPNLLLLDEPTANIDKKSIQKIESILLEYNKRGKTIILVTHDFEQAKRLTNQILKLEAGKLIWTNV